MSGISQSGAVTTVRIDYSGGNTEHTLFLASDLHVDATTCNRAVMLSDLQDAVNKNAMIFLFGDIFDAMPEKQGWCARIIVRVNATD